MARVDVLCREAVGEIGGLHWQVDFPHGRLDGRTRGAEHKAIDAHAEGLGTVGVVGADPTQDMAYVFGTSSCTTTTTQEPVFVPGVWGPYRSAMLPDMWLNEGGQSAAGAASDHLLKLHPANAEATALARGEGMPLAVWLAKCSMKPNPSEAARLATGLHVVPELLGNCAPFANPQAWGLIVGIGMGRNLKA